MLKAFKKNRELKISQKAEDLLEKGMTQLNGKLYKQAMIEFQNAYQLEPNITLKRLDTEFSHYLELLDHEAALSIGLVLIKIRKDDYELVNTLGNCARKQKDYKQANNLYRHSLKINRNYPIAFYNLAASMGKVEKYDGDIKKSFQVLAGIKEHVLPEYAEDPDFEQKVENNLKTKASKTFQRRIKDLEQQISNKVANDDIQEAKVLGIDLEELKRKGDGPTKKDYEEYYTELITVKNADDQNEADKKTQLRNLYNYGIFLLRRKKTEMASKAFQQVRESPNTFKYLDMLIAITMAISGQTKEAIKFFVDELGKNQYNRFFNINLGFMYKDIGNRLLATKYLAIGAELLEKSDGLFNLSDLLEIADQSAADGKYKKALKLYNVAIGEVENVDIWAKIGEVHAHLKNYDEATNAYREILKLQPESRFAIQQLKQMHDLFSARAEGFFLKSKFQAAASMYEKALRIVRPMETIKQAASVYKVMGNTARVEALNQEYEDILKKEREMETEKHRKELIKLGRLHISRKNYKLGIETLEQAFRIKLDKDVFVMLATVYKSLKKKAEMQDLLDRWNKLVEYEEKMKKFEKDEQRAKMANN